MNAISRSVPAVRLEVVRPVTQSSRYRAPGPRVSAAMELPAYALPPRASPMQGRWLIPLFAMASDSIGKALRMRGFQHRTVATQHATMHALDAQGWGPLPPVVVFPGFGAQASDYVKLLWKLLPHCQRVIALDPPGHGRSELPDMPNTATVGSSIRDALDTLIGGRFILVGHSAGGYNAARYTLENPERVQGLVLAGTAGGPYTPEQEAYYARILSVATWEDAKDLAHRTWGHVPLLGAAIAASTYASMSAAPLRALVDSDLLRLWLQPEELGSLQCPILYMWGEREDLLPPHFYSYFVQNLPKHAEIEVVEGLGHATVLAGGRKSTNRVLEFCNRVAAMERAEDGIEQGTE